MKITVTENKSVGQLSSFDTKVRVFVNDDYGYGYFISEQLLVSMLSEAQLAEYLTGSTAKLDVSPDVAQAIIDAGATVFAKPSVAEKSESA